MRAHTGVSLASRIGQELTAISGEDDELELLVTRRVEIPLDHLWVVVDVWWSEIRYSERLVFDGEHVVQPVG